MSSHICSVFVPSHPVAAIERFRTFVSYSERAHLLNLFSNSFPDSPYSLPFPLPPPLSHPNHIHDLSMFPLILCFACLSLSHHIQSYPIHYPNPIQLVPSHDHLPHSARSHARSSISMPYNHCSCTNWLSWPCPIPPNPSFNVSSRPSYAYTRDASQSSPDMNNPPLLSRSYLRRYTAISINPCLLYITNCNSLARDFMYLWPGW